MFVCISDQGVGNASFSGHFTHILDEWQINEHIFWGSSSHILCKVVVLKNFAKLTAKHLQWSPFLIKLQARNLKLYSGIFLWSSQILSEKIYATPSCKWYVIDKKRTTKLYLPTYNSFLKVTKTLKEIGKDSS